MQGREWMTLLAVPSVTVVTAVVSIQPSCPCQTLRIVNSIPGTHQCLVLILAIRSGSVSSVFTCFFPSMSSLGAPPIFTPNLNVIRIDTTTSSKIAAVNLYFGKAQITRVYAFRASPGANRLVISGLPESMDNSTLRWAFVVLGMVRS